MPEYTIKVKWGKEVFRDVQVDTDQEPMLFKAQLFALTGVQPIRQKVMLNGTTLKDDDWGKIKLRDGITMLMMGSKEEDVPSEPTQKQLFLEDMNETELASVLDLPAGLNNLGNTCYLNATVQCLKTVPELREALYKVPGSHTSNDASEFRFGHSITIALRDLYKGMDGGSSVLPVTLVHMMHLAFPRFAEKTEHGVFQQQDANECWIELIRMLQQKLPPKDNPAALANSENKPQSLIDQFFGGTFETELKCHESDDEPVTKGKEDFLQLSCYMFAPEVRNMYKGLESKMKESITKMSTALGRDAVYTKTSKISKLPAYLTIQFVRFQYKEKQAINAKILKNVKFTLEFDAFELCTKELQAKLTPMREKFKQIEDQQIEESRKFDKQDQKKDVVKKEGTKLPYWFEDDIGSNNSGFYVLQAVLTHIGRSSTCGHYVAWIRQKDDVWIKCDDDVVSVVTKEEILKLSGGGDWHCAYVLLYGPKILEIPNTSDDK